MKKNFFITMLSLICVLCLSFGLVACGGKNSGNTDKSLRNADFVQYRKKITAVIKDNGMHVNDFDSDKNARSSSNGVKSAIVKEFATISEYTSDSTGIADAVMSDADKQESIRSIVSMRDELFEQTFFISLMLGDGISNFYNQKKFYNIPVLFEEWEQYFDVTNQNGIDYVRCYMPKGFFEDKEMFVVAYIDYTSTSNYTWTFLQYTHDLSNAIYAHGTSAKEFYCVSKANSNSDSNYLLYASDNYVGYESTVQSSVNACFEKVKSYFNMMPQNEMRALINNRHTINAQQQAQLSEKYFGTSSNKIYGVRFANNGEDILINGKKIITEYIAREGERVVELPEDEEYYLFNNFQVIDTSNSVMDLKIPKNIVGIVAENKDDAGNLKGDFYAESDVYDLNFSLYCDENNDGNGIFKAFNNFIVESGSPLFGSGAGHLKDKDGKIVFLADYPLETLDFDLLKNIDITAYNNLFNNLHDISINLRDFYNSDMGDYDDLSVIERIIGVAKKPLNLYLNSYKDESVLENSAWFSLDLKPANDLTIYIDFKSKNLCGGSFNFENPKSEQRSIKVYINSIPKYYEGTVQFYYQKNFSADYYFDMTKEYYDMFHNNCIYTAGLNPTTHFNSGGMEESKFNGMQLTHSIYNNMTGAVKIDEVSDNAYIVIPDNYYDADIAEVRLNTDVLKEKSVKIELPVNVNGIVFYTNRQTGEDYNGIYLGSVQNENLILKYNGTYSDFCSESFTYDQLSETKFTVECSDDTYVYSSNGNNGDSGQDSFEVTITFGETTIYTEQCFENCELKLDEAFLDFQFKSNYAYYLFGNDDSVYCVNENKSYFPHIYAKKGVNYTLVKHAFGNFDEEELNNYTSQYTTMSDGKETTVSVRYGIYPAESDSNFKIDVVLIYNWDENVRVDSTRFDILGGILYKTIGESGPEEIRQELSVKFLWDIQNGEIVGLSEIIMTEIKQDEGDKKE